MADPIRRRSLSALLEQHLQQLTAVVPEVSVFMGEVPPAEDLPVKTITTGETTVPDPSGRIAPYVVAHTGDGTPFDGETPLDGDWSGSLDWPFTLTLAAGFTADLEHLLDETHILFDRWRPAPVGEAYAGLRFGHATPPDGFDAGPIRRDPSVKPVRFFIALPFVLPVHR